jgi:hypothetical protein
MWSAYGLRERKYTRSFTVSSICASSVWSRQRTEVTLHWRSFNGVSMQRIWIAASVAGLMVGAFAFGVMASKAKSIDRHMLQLERQLVLPTIPAATHASIEERAPRSRIESTVADDSDCPRCREQLSVGPPFEPILTSKRKD